VEQSWDSLANFSKRQAGRVGGSSVDYAQLGGGESTTAAATTAATSAKTTAAIAAAAAGSSGSAMGRRIIPDLPMDDSLSAMASHSTPSGGGEGGEIGRNTSIMLANVFHRFFNPRLLSYITSYDVAGIMNLAFGGGGGGSGVAAMAAAAILSEEEGRFISDPYPDPSWEFFTVPERPRGQTLKIVIHSTW